MQITIFYSWQSDRKPNINKNFIQDAINLAIEQINSEDSFEVEASIDRDTQGESGSPAIAETILKKIKQCSLFLCDVTFISPLQAKRHTPNPNVLIELGYAAATIGWERIVCVMNEHFGKPENLPFDVLHRRWPIRYIASEKITKEERLKVKNELSRNIEYAIRTAIQSGVIKKAVDPKDFRVARRFEFALSSIRSTLTQIFALEGDQDVIKIFDEDQADETGKEYPSPDTIQRMITVFARSNLSAQSNASTIEGVPFSWYELIVQDLQNLYQESERILNHYSDRNDSLIALVEDVQRRASFLIHLLTASFTILRDHHLYDNGVPEIHVDHFRYFFLALLKSYRVIRSFGRPN